MKQRPAAPHLVDAEVAQVLRRYVQPGVLSASYGRQALAGLAALRIVRHDHRWLLPAVWPLRDQMTAYDALYVALARRSKLPCGPGTTAWHAQPASPCPSSAPKRRSCGSRVAWE